MPYTIDSAKAALAAGDASIQSIAAETGWPIINDCLVPEPGTWHANDGNAEITYDLEPGTIAEGYHETRVASGEEAAQSYVDTGDWGEDRNSTSWVNVRVWREAIDSDGDLVRVDEETIKITLEPD